MSQANFSLQFDAQHRVLLITAGKHLSEEMYLTAYAAVVDFVATHGPCSTIFDMTFVETFDLSTKFVHSLAVGPPAIPAPMKRVAVATAREIYNAFCVFEALRLGTGLPVTLMRTMDEAYAIFGASASDFTPVASI